MSEAATTTTTATTEAPQTGTERGHAAEAQATDTAQTAEQALAELAEGDFDKLIPVKDEAGKVQKVKLKDFIKEAYGQRTKAKRAQEATEQKIGATVKELVNYAKANPRDFMSRIGINPEEFAEMTLTEKVKALEMSPEQRRIAEYEAKIKKFEEQEAERQKTESKTKEEQAYNQEVQRLDQEISEAFSKSGLPKSKFFLQMATAVMHNDAVRYQNEVEEHGYASRDPLSASEALGIVKESVPNLIKETLSQMDLNQVRQLLGSDVLEKIRQDDIQRVQNQVAKKTPSTGTPTKKEKQKVFTRDTEYRDWVESRKRKTSRDVP